MDRTIVIFSLSILLPHLNVGLLLENVVMRSKKSQDHVSRALHVEAILTKAEDLCPCARSRLIWTNVDVEFVDPEKISWRDCVSSGWAPAFLGVEPSGGFGTFLRPFTAGEPSEYPASFPRLPLSSYDRRGLVVRTDLEPGILAVISNHLDLVDSASGDSRDPTSTSYLRRKDLCEHTA